MITTWCEVKFCVKIMNTIDFRARKVIYFHFMLHFVCFKDVSGDFKTQILICSSSCELEFVVTLKFECKARTSNTSTTLKITKFIESPVLKLVSPDYFITQTKY